MAKLPGVAYRRAVRALEKAGFRVTRESKHIYMTNGDVGLTLPRHDPINGYTMACIVEDAGLTIDEFKKLL